MKPASVVTLIIFFVGGCLSNSVDIPIIRIEEVCSTNYSCSENIQNSYCQLSFDEKAQLSGVCKCEVGYTSSEDQTRCLESQILIGNECEESVQCVESDAGRSVCLPSSGICDCKPGFVHSRNVRRCLPIVNTLAKETCEDDAQCQLGNPGKHSKCSRNRSNSKYACNCNSYAVEGQEGNYTNTCFRRAKKFGHACKVQAQCTSNLKNSVCIDGECVRRKKTQKTIQKRDKKEAIEDSKKSAAALLSGLQAFKLFGSNRY